MRIEPELRRFERHVESATSWQASRLRYRCARKCIVSTALFLLAVSLTGCPEKAAPAATAPPEVVVASAMQQDVPVHEEWVAQLNGPVNADITPKVQGYLLSQNYVNGSLVKKGQLLFQIDPRPFQAALDQAKAEVERTVSSLSKATNDVQRDTPLAGKNAIPQKKLDVAISNQAAAHSELTAKKAAQEQDELNLGWTNVYSPVDGIAGV